MAGTDKPLFQRPIEITADINGLSVGDVGGGLSDITIDVGVYSSMTALMYAWETAIDTEIGGGNDFSMSWNYTSGELYIQNQFTSGGAKAIGLSSAETQANQRIILAMMGVDWVAVDAGNHSVWEWDDVEERYQWAADSASAIVNDYRPEYVWLPSYQNALQDRWYPNHRETWSGSQAKTGELGGITTGPTLYYRPLRFTNETAENLFVEAATDRFMADRCLETFIEGARGSYPTVSGNPSTAGFFFTQDIGNRAEIPGDTDGVNTADDIGINNDYSTTAQGETESADNHTWCQFDTNPFRGPVAAHPTGRTYYNVDFEIHSIDVDAMPTWQAPDQS